MTEKLISAKTLNMLQTLIASENQFNKFLDEKIPYKSKRQTKTYTKYQN